MTEPETIIVEMEFASRLYGTATPQSDLDYKGVYLPSARDILLQRAKPVVSLSRDKQPGEKNAPGDVDREFYSLQRYFELLAEGQTVAIDMLFAPDTAMIRPPSPLWQEIRANTGRLVTRQSVKMLRYCQQQANKFGIKGSRIAAARLVLEILRQAEAQYGSNAKLAVVEAEILALSTRSEHVALIDIPGPENRLARHLEVAGRKAPFTSSLKIAREILERLVAAYGERAHQAERDEGIDWKALSHAVRVGREGVELLTTGHIEFPLSYATHLLAIKQGKLSFQQIRDEIEQLLVDVEEAARRSTLHDHADVAFMEALITRAHLGQIRKELGDAA